jgi:tetratricopeptide (TPR) repeat protein
MQNEPAANSDAYRQAKSEDMRALQLKPDLVGAIDLMASIDMQAGQYEEAIAQCRAALEHSPDDETATYRLLISLKHVGKTEELQTVVKRLKELHQQSLKNETARRRFSLVERLPSSEPSSTSN